MGFAPGLTTRLDASEASRQVPVDREAPHVLVTNLGPAVAFVRYGTGDLAASPMTDLPVLPASQLVLDKGVGADRVAVLTAEGTATVYVTVGRAT